jgi:hypothetical protein
MANLPQIHPDTHGQSQFTVSELFEPPLDVSMKGVDKVNEGRTMGGLSPAELVIETREAWRS